jgi:hypothetical protein
MLTRINQLFKAWERRPVNLPATSSTESVNSNQGHKMVPREEHQLVQLKYTRLEFPRFNGDHLIGWVYKANQFFIFHDTQQQYKRRD